MCGITGLAGVDLLKDDIKQILERMTTAILHRGPDDAGYFVTGSVGLGMRRLGIIDLEGGKQPIHNETETIHVVCNGEIYNYRELRTSLEESGHKFYTGSDTEVVVHAYEEYGERCFEKFRGMFAVALWDGDRRQLLMAVDRLGIKPLYYANTGRDLVFGSELKCLTVSARVGLDLNYDALAQYFTLGYIPAPATIFKPVNKLLPGHYLCWTPSGGARTQAYWDLPTDGVRFDRPLFQTRTELLELLKDAVRSHLISDVSLGAFLSGGIDSSSIVALMSQVMSEPVKTFSIGFAEKEYCELDKARLVAQHFQTDHHEMIVEPETVDVLPKLVSHFGEPFADSSALPTYYLSKMAREHVKVALSGDGGDEFFLGYTTFQGLEFARYMNKVPPVFCNAASAILKKMDSTGRADGVSRWKKRISDSMLPVRDAYYSKITIGGLDAVFPALSRELREKMGSCRPFDAVSRYLDAYPSNKDTDPLDPFIYAGIKTSLPGDMLVKVDRMSMANSLEVRVPLLDHVLAEFVATIPVSQRFPHWRLKGLLKDTMAGLLPDEILKQPKRGFVIPLSAWFRGDMSSFVRDTLFSELSLRSGFWDEEGLRKMLDEHSQGEKNHGTAIWSMLMLALWYQDINK